MAGMLPCFRLAQEAKEPGADGRTSLTMRLAQEVPGPYRGLVVSHILQSGLAAGGHLFNEVSRSWNT